ncbi:fatty acid desaturase [Roseiconus lacunae]|uniref:Fatty acid desaturase n=1 Tax=Roseiconus lacunae TaxID=2605694 RepID=A0ABT7PNY4_9BACT|nr:fatty acid desaturase [Roseiconus lacunae]MDM4018198.1 fatty acid desaturase [Roseiconus lacunae]
MQTSVKKGGVDDVGPVPVRKDCGTKRSPRCKGCKRKRNPRLEASPVGVVREEWKDRFPAWMQFFLTWLIGCPFKGQRPLIANKPWWLAVAIPVAILALGLATAFACVMIGGEAMVLLPIAWLMEVHGARTLQVHICHQGVHGNLTGISWLDQLIVEVVSTLLLIQSEEDYRNDHCGTHHPALASSEDPDRQFTVEIMGLQPGRSVAQNLVAFFGSMLSPKIHAIFAIGRVRSNLTTNSRIRRLAALAWIAFVAVIVAMFIGPIEFILTVFIPLVILYSLSAMCQFVTEHFWVTTRLPGQSAKEHNNALLINRHLGDPLPSTDCTGVDWLWQWSLWWMRLWFYHLPFRVGVLVGDLPVHGSHHMWPKESRWTEALYSFRERSEASGKTPTEFVGGYFALLHQVLESFATEKRQTASATRNLDLSEAIKVANGM